MNNCGERLKNGIITENPIFVLMLGMCPTLAVTTSAINGIGMGLSTTVVLVMSNMLISMLRKVIPDLSLIHIQMCIRDSQEIEAKVVDFNGEDRKISLSMKALEDNSAEQTEE